MSRRSPRHAARSKAPFPLLLVGLAVVAGAVTLWHAWGSGGEDRADGGSPSAQPSTSDPPSPGPTGSTGSPSPSGVPTPGPINTEFPGITTFRGNATRDYYGEGPVPMHPVIRWNYPESGGLCSTSADAAGSRVWCGTGWTGQPNVIVHEDGKIEIREGAYDGHYHFLNGRTGRPMRPDLVTGDLAKGSATSDPEGYPLYYAGSRDNRFRIIAMDRPSPTVLWSMNADTTVARPLWNNDWDGAALVLGDYLLEGGENSWFYVVKINRGYDDTGKVTVDPKIVATIPGYDEQLLSDAGDEEVSIENSVAFRDGIVYFANSGGLVQGWDISDLLDGGTKYHRVFRFWTGDDTDGSIVIDDEGFLYVGERVPAVQRTEPAPRPADEARSVEAERPDRVVDPGPGDRVRGGGRQLVDAGVVQEVRVLHDGGRTRAGGRAPERHDRVGAGYRLAGDRVAGGRGRRADPGRLHRGVVRVGRLVPRRRSRRYSGRCSSGAAWSRRPRCGTAGSTWGPGWGRSTASPIGPATERGRSNPRT